MRGMWAWVLLVLLLLAQLAASFWAMALTARGVLLALPPLDAAAQLFGGRMTLVFAVSAGLAALLPGSLAAIAMWRLRVAGPVLGILASPLLLPLPVLMVQYEPQAWPIIGIVAGQGIALGALCGALRLRRLEHGVLKAAASCGWGPFAAYRKLVLRRLAPGMLAAFVLAVCLQVVAVMGLDSLSAATPGHAGMSIPAMRNSLLLAGGLAIALCLLITVALGFLRRR
jgi:putative spermidine/putrescine transport system permease protein